jgi:hypothetical protein
MLVFGASMHSRVINWAIDLHIEELVAIEISNAIREELG